MSYINFFSAIFNAIFQYFFHAIFDISLTIFKFNAILENLCVKRRCVAFNVYGSFLKETKIYARLFLQPIIHVFKIHQGKTVISSIKGTHLYLLVILHLIRMSLICHSCVTRISFVCHSYVNRMYSYIIRMSLVCTRISFICQSSVFVCHSYVTRMYSYVIRMSHVCTRMSSVCHSYVTRMYSCVTRIGRSIKYVRREGGRGGLTNIFGSCKRTYFMNGLYVFFTMN